MPICWISSSNKPLNILIRASDSTIFREGFILHQLHPAAQTNHDNAIIRLFSSQSLDGETNSTDMDSFCSYTYTPDRVEIVYQETGLEETVAPLTHITVLPGPVLTIQRNGAYGMDLLLEQGKTHETVYRIPETEMKLTVYTKKIKYAFHESGGMLLAQYSLNLNDTIRTNHSIRLHVRTTTQKPGTGTD